MRRIEGAVRSGRDIADLVPGPRAVRDLGVVEEALRLVVAVAVDESRAFLAREGDLDFLGEPLVDIHRGIVEQALRRRRHGVDLHGREGQLGQRRRVGLRARRSLGHPARRGAGDGERLLVDRRAHRAVAGDGADRRDLLHAAQDRRFRLRRHQIPAVGIGVDRQRLLLERVQARRFAPAHIAVERGLVLEKRPGRIVRRQRQARPRALQGEPVHQRLLLIERLVDAVDLLGRHHVLRHGPLDRADLVVVLLLEDLEGLQEALESERHIVTGAARRRGHDGGGGHGGSRHADGHVVLAAIHARLDLEAVIRNLVRRDIFGFNCFVHIVHRQSSSWGQKISGQKFRVGNRTWGCDPSPRRARLQPSEFFRMLSAYRRETRTRNKPSGAGGKEIALK